jgi:hypothetical protein
MSMLISSFITSLAVLVGAILWLPLFTLAFLMFLMEEVCDLLGGLFGTLHDKAKSAAEKIRN